MKPFITLLTQCRHIEQMLEGVWVKKYFRQNDIYENLNILSFACVMILHIQADQLLTQLLIEQLDTLP